MDEVPDEVSDDSLDDHMEDDYVAEDTENVTLNIGYSQKISSVNDKFMDEQGGSFEDKVEGKKGKDRNGRHRLQQEELTNRNRKGGGDDINDSGYLVEEEFETIDDGSTVELIKTEREETEYTCVVCLSKFVTAEELEEHNKIHGDIDVHKCSLCSKSFLAAHHLRRHIKECRKTFRVPPCEMCGYQAKDVEEAASHAAVHVVRKPFSCPQCPFETIRYAGMSMHFRSAHRVPVPLKSGKC